MSTMHFDQFRQAISIDSMLQEKLAQSTSREDFYNLAVELGKAKGYNFTTEDIATIVNKNTTRNEPDYETELSVDQLESIAGADMGCNTKKSKDGSFCSCC